MNLMIVKGTVLAALSVFAISVQAGSTPLAEQNKANNRTQAIAACNGKLLGEDCSFVGVNNYTLGGMCRKAPKLTTGLICAPKPPKSAVEACQDKAAGDSCSFIGANNENKNGTCRKLPGSKGQ